VEAVARAVMQRLLHEPTIRLKAGDGRHGRQQLLRELFGIDDAPAGADAAAGAAPPAADNVRALKRRG
jgi:glutamyl-tRNA reductase